MRICLPKAFYQCKKSTTNFFFSLLFVKLNRQTIRISKKSKTLAGKFINPDGLNKYILRLNMMNSFLNIINLKSDVPQSGCFGSRRASGRVWKRKKLDLVKSCNFQIKLI